MQLVVEEPRLDLLLLLDQAKSKDKKDGGSLHMRLSGRSYRMTWQTGCGHFHPRGDMETTILDRIAIFLVLPQLLQYIVAFHPD